MNTSHLYASHHGAFSPNGTYIAVATNDRLVIRTNGIEPAVLHVFQCAYPTQYLAWSPNSTCICTANFDKGVVEAWSLVDTHWRCQIMEPGIRRIWWSPDSTSILCSSDQNMRISSWLLLDQQVRYIKHPKFHDKGCESSPDGKYIAIAQLHQGKDYIGIYTSSGDTLLHHFATNTHDLAGLCWTPDGKYLIVWDHSLYYNFVIYRPDGGYEASYQPSEDGLGIKSVTCSPDSRLVAIGGYDRKVRLLRTSDWQLVGTLSHETSLLQADTEVFVYQADSSSKRTDNHPSFYPLSRRPLDIPVIRPDYNAANPKIGVSVCQFSSDSHYLCTFDDSMPTALWLWDILYMTCRLVVIHHQVIRQITWNPQDPDMLATSCGGNDVLLIKRHPPHSENLSIKASNFDVRRLIWSQNGDSLLIASKTMFCLAKVPD
ncbi:hypothetical protein LRAMOSA09578 [Lichtheimia ramosa]|uniref:Anaphase-promoting complex subunit 4 WD40 domain-containing protein n=1 Tax=Lichtheimia ramosa TaxID=688394 RepID=A0A077WIA6_9FUNG|nr:hypothetical protein LRAMOSA09578 [Lichtheimia ramosa]